ESTLRVSAWQEIPGFLQDFSFEMEPGLQILPTPPLWPQKCTLTGEAWRKAAGVGLRCGGGVWLDPASAGLCGRGGEPPRPRRGNTGDAAG
uniref:Uncharacterized protein n=1 Tax=Aquila chrysaetos chrysaetos TaxID=223781 RepID=A0A663FG71_AQUCH